MASISTLGQALARSDRITLQQQQVELLTAQISTGKKTDKLSGLGVDLLTSQRARSDLSRTDQYITNITNAERQINLMLAAIEEFQAQAENFSNFFFNMTQESAHQEGDLIRYDDPATTNVVETTPVGYTSAEPDIDLSTMIDFADNIFKIFGDLINEKDTDGYLFAGADSSKKPLQNTSLLDTALNGAINNWKSETITTDDLIADLRSGDISSGNTDAITDTIIGFSSILSSGNAAQIYVRSDDSTEVPFTVLANEQPFRDILVAAAFIKSESLPPMADQVDPNTLAVITNGAPGADVDEMKENFFAVFNELGRMVNTAIDEIDQVRFRLENARVQIVETRTQHQKDTYLFEDIIAGVENIDDSEVAVRLNALTLQLDASVRVTARVQQISLVNYL